MFDIEYKGANCVIINTKKSKLIIDPKISLAGLKDVSVKGSVELATEERFIINDKEAKLIIDSPGEYGVSNFDISGISSRRHIDGENEIKVSTIYRIEIGDVRICVLGNIFGNLSDDQLEKIGLIDVLILPVGGNGYTLDATSAVGIVKAIDPKVVVPIHYADESIKYEVMQDSLATFISELGAPVETVSKYKVKQLASLQNTLSVVELTRS